MRAKIDSIIAAQAIMTVATLRPDGWPQATTVGYANEGLLLYFVISRHGQKFANIARDDRVSIAIARDGATAEIEGLSMSARALELRDEPRRGAILHKLSERHPGYFDREGPDWSHAALMRAHPHVISLVDFSKGLGHADTLTLGADQMLEGEAARPNDWGPGPAHAA